MFDVFEYVCTRALTNIQSRTPISLLIQWCLHMHKHLQYVCWYKSIALDIESHMHISLLIQVCLQTHAHTHPHTFSHTHIHTHIQTCRHAHTPVHRHRDAYVNSGTYVSM